jgi:hypothetical protein
MRGTVGATFGTAEVAPDSSSKSNVVGGQFPGFSFSGSEIDGGDSQSLFAGARTENLGHSEIHVRSASAAAFQSIPIALAIRSVCMRFSAPTRSRYLGSA